MKAGDKVYYDGLGKYPIRPQRRVGIIDCRGRGVIETVGGCTEGAWMSIRLDSGIRVAMARPRMLQCLTFI